MNFDLNEVEKERALKFFHKCKKKLKGKSDVRLSYHFYPTGIGNTVKVRSETLGIEKDITDFDSM